MTVLSHQTIRKLSEGKLEKTSLIYPFDLSKCMAASYDLGVGDEYYVHRADSDEALVRKLPPEGSFSIPPGELAFIITAEKLNLPTSVSARVTLALGFTRKGVLLGAQPPIDPGYSGQVICLVHNLGDRAVPLYRGDHILTVEFFGLDEDTEKPYGKHDRYMGLETLRSLVTEPRTTVQVQLAQELRELKRQQQGL